MRHRTCTRSGERRTDGGTGPIPTALGLVFRTGVVLAGTTGRVHGSTVAGTDRPIVQVHPTAAVTLSAALGDVQAFADRLRGVADKYELEHDAPMGLEALATRAGSLRRAADGGRLLLGGVDADGPGLYVVDADGGILEERYAAVGSGTQLAVGALEGGYDDDLGREAATDLARSALESARARDAGSVGPAAVATITDEGVSIEELA